MVLRQKNKAGRRAKARTANLSPRSHAKVVVAIPCWNTAPFVPDIIGKARKYAEQVTVIDDGSHDDTGEMASLVGAEVICHARNQGYGRAIRSCLEAGRTNGADILVILDGDGQHDPDEIPKLLLPILNREADIVIGSRFFFRNGAKPHLETDPAGHRSTRMPRHRKFGIGVITSLFNLGARVKVSDAQSGFCAYSKEVFNSMSLQEKGMSVGIEILAKARRAGFTIKEVPISCRYFQSHLTLETVKHGLTVALSVVRIRLNHRV